MLRVFLDANVYFAGCLSPHGASALVLRLARHGAIHLVTSRLVLREADRNLRTKADRKTLRTFHQLLDDTPVAVVPTPDEETLRPFDAGHGLRPWALAQGRPERVKRVEGRRSGATGFARGDPRFEAAIHPKDVPVLAAAVEAKVDYLVTLDRRHFLVSSVSSIARPIKVVTPGGFLKDCVRRSKRTPHS